MSAEPEPIQGEARRGSRDRRVTERRILDATWRLFDRGGPLAGINLQEVADEAGVNRSLVYQYFGTREQLVRSALAERLKQARQLYRAGRALPFAERKRQAFAVALADPAPTRLMTQLVLAGDEELRVLPMLDASRGALARDLADGSLPPGADAEVMHAMTVGGARRSGRRCLRADGGRARGPRGAGSAAGGRRAGPRGVGRRAVARRGVVRINGTRGRRRCPTCAIA